MRCTPLARRLAAPACALTLAALMLPALAQPGPFQTTANRRPVPAEILWDRYGIPHIYGRDITTVLRGYGYAQMKNHAETLLGNIAQARGRSAEYFGPGAGNAYVTSDIKVRTLGIPQRARRWLIEGGGEQRRYLEATVAGMNQYAQRHGATIDPSFRQILPITAEDLLADFQNTITFSFQASQSGVPQLLAAWQQGGIAAANGGSAQFAAAAHNGSNGWALSPYKSTSGNAILMGNPHLPWGNNTPAPGMGLFQWMEAQLVVGDPARPEVNISGVSFPGSAFIGIGFNDDLGWTHTNNTIKNADLYELTLTSPGTYLWEGGSLPLAVSQDSLRIRLPDGSYAAQPFTIASSVHGPIIAQQGNKALALRVAGLDAPSVVSQYWGMARARSLSEFAEANSALQMPFFNVVYADRYGHVMYLFGGRQPVRSGGTFYDWAGILPGDKRSALWTDTLSWRELPKTIDPPGGFVQNCNDAPWTSSFPQSIFLSSYPKWIAPDFMELRPQHCAKFLLSRDRFTSAQVLAGKMSTHMELADRLLPDLLAAARASGDATALAAAATLAAWDGNADAASRGAVLFERWYNLYAANPAVPRDPTLVLYFSHPAFRIGWDPARPLTTPQGLGETRIAVSTLVQAAQQVQALYGALDVPWGQVHRTVLATHDPSFQQVIPVSNAPLSGAGDVFGPIRTVNPFPAPDGKSYWHADGDGYVQLVEFTRNGPKAQALLTYGNASRPGSPHITDQLPVFDAKQLRPSLRTRREVEANAVEREVF